VIRQLIEKHFQAVCKRPQIQFLRIVMVVANVVINHRVRISRCLSIKRVGRSVWP
jgi:hypothetical protein